MMMCCAGPLLQVPWPPAVAGVPQGCYCWTGACHQVRRHQSMLGELFVQRLIQSGSHSCSDHACFCDGQMRTQHRQSMCLPPTAHALLCCFPAATGPRLACTPRRSARPCCSNSTASLAPAAAAVPACRISSASLTAQCSRPAQHLQQLDLPLGKQCQCGSVRQLLSASDAAAWVCQASAQPAAPAQAAASRARDAQGLLCLTRTFQQVLCLCSRWAPAVRTYLSSSKDGVYFVVGSCRGM